MQVWDFLVFFLGVAESNITVDGCEFFRNGSIGIEISNIAPDRMVKVTNTKIWDNAIDGLFAHQFASLELGQGNEIYNNKGKGLFISSDSVRILSESNRIQNNLGGDSFVEEFRQVPPEERASRRKGEISAAIKDAVASGKCTYLRTGPHYYVQQWYHCRTCRLVDNEGCCEVCRYTCHAGHDVDTKPCNTSIFFCDCGSSGNCKSVRAAQEQDRHSAT
jgi:hypothetical protein